MGSHRKWSVAFPPMVDHDMKANVVIGPSIIECLGAEAPSQIVSPGGDDAYVVWPAARHPLRWVASSSASSSVGPAGLG